MNIEESSNSLYVKVRVIVDTRPTLIVNHIPGLD